MTTETTKFLDAVKTLEINGHEHLAMAALGYYDRMTQGMGIAQRAQIIELFDDVLGKALQTRDTIHPTEILLSQDFTFLKALARTLQELELTNEGLDTDVIVLGELDVDPASEFELKLEALPPVFRQRDFAGVPRIPPMLYPTSR